MDIFLHHPLQSYNTFGIEAYAQEFTEIETDGDLAQMINSRKSQSSSILILGGGSNILLTGDVRGTVIRVNTHGRKVIYEDTNTVHLRVAAGEDWDELVAYCVSNGWGGLENLSGIPGQVGSSPIQNIGAYGTELKDHFVSLEAINRCTGEMVHMDSERCEFGYRDSIFKRALKGRVVITQVTFHLSKKPEFNLSYHSLKNYLAHVPQQELTLKKVRDIILQIRASKLPDPKMIGNAGSFFKNPVVSLLELEKLKERFPDVVYFKAPGAQSLLFPNHQIGEEEREGVANGQRPASGAKLSAGWLIEQCGWKGFREGDAGVHKDQALVLVNYGKASGMDILKLSEKIRLSVMEKFGVELEREVNVV